MIKVLPSSNPCPEDELLKYVKQLETLGIEYLHCDVMDGKFVSNECLSFDTLRNIRNNSNILLDVHLMSNNVFSECKKFSGLKPNIITFHYEALKSERELFKTIKYLKSKDILVGMAIKPNTPIEIVERLTNYIDLLLIMSVEPGMSGQKFIDDVYDKINNAGKKLANKDIIIEVDGGINETNFEKVVSCGAKFLVMGSAFYNAKDKKKLLCKIDSHYKR